MSDLKVYDIKIEEFKSKRKHTLIKSKVASAFSIGFYTLGLASVVVLTRKHNLDSTSDIGLYLKETLSSSCACCIIGTATKHLRNSYKNEAETYESEIATIEEQKKLVK